MHIYMQKEQMYVCRCVTDTWKMNKIYYYFLLLLFFMKMHPKLFLNACCEWIFYFYFYIFIFWWNACGCTMWGNFCECMHIFLMNACRCINAYNDVCDEMQLMEHYYFIITIFWWNACECMMWGEFLWMHAVMENFLMNADCGCMLWEKNFLSNANCECMLWDIFVMHGMIFFSL